MIKRIHANKAKVILATALFVALFQLCGCAQKDIQTITSTSTETSTHAQEADIVETTTEVAEQPEAVEQTLDNALETDSTSWPLGGKFSGAQEYQGVVYLAPLRTLAGPVFPKDIPNTQAIPKDASSFIISEDTLYYAEYYPGNGTGAVSLYEYDLESGAEKELANDVLSLMRPCLGDGYIVYQSADESLENPSTFKAINLETAEVTEIAEAPYADGVVGIHDGVAYLCVGGQTLDNDKALLTVELGNNSGWNTTNIATLSHDAMVVALYEDQVLLEDLSLDSKALLLDRDGTTTNLDGILDIQRSGIPAWYSHNGKLYISCYDSLNSLREVDCANATIRELLHDVSWALNDVLFATDETLYFAQFNTSDMDAYGQGHFDVIDLDLNSEQAQQESEPGNIEPPLSSWDEACTYIRQQLEQSGNEVPPHVGIQEWWSADGYDYLVCGWGDAQGLADTWFVYGVNADGAIHDIRLDRDIDPTTMQGF